MEFPRAKTCSRLRSGTMALMKPSCMMVRFYSLWRGCLSPELIACPRCERADVANVALLELLFEGGDGHADDFHIRLLGIAVVCALLQVFGNKYELALAGEPVGNPHPGQGCHAAGA